MPKAKPYHLHYISILKMFYMFCSLRYEAQTKLVVLHSMIRSLTMFHKQHTGYIKKDSCSIPENQNNILHVLKHKENNLYLPLCEHSSL